MKPNLDMVQSLIGLRFFSYITSKRVGLSWERLQHLQFVQCSALSSSETPGTFKDRTWHATPEQQKLQTVETGPRVLQRAEVVEGRGFSVFILFPSPKKSKNICKLDENDKFHQPVENKKESAGGSTSTWQTHFFLMCVYEKEYECVHPRMFRCMCLCGCVYMFIYAYEGQRTTSGVILRSLMGLDFTIG